MTQGSSREQKHSQLSHHVLSSIGGQPFASFEGACTAPPIQALLHLPPSAAPSTHSVNSASKLVTVKCLRTPTYKAFHTNSGGHARYLCTNCNQKVAALLARWARPCPSSSLGRNSTLCGTQWTRSQKKSNILACILASSPKGGSTHGSL